MNCASCGRANRDGARFCGGCGGSLAPRCPACGAECEADARFCDSCGGSLAAKSVAPVTPAGARKVVTIVFADLVGSTALHERLDPESARRFMESYYDATRGAVGLHGGTVTQLLGDGVKAVFGIPLVAEDDAIRAVRAAVAMQQAFRALADEQRGAVGKTGLRVAVNTGEVVANDDAEIIGDPVNVAARLQEQGKDGDVVIGDATARLVESLVTLELLGSFALKGRSEAVKAYRVESLDAPAGAATAAFVGRDDELARLAAVFGTAIAKPAAALAVLLGSPGLGKSRLIVEFARRRSDQATVVAAHCDAAGGASFAPLADALRELLGIDAGANAEALRAATLAALPETDAERARIAGGIAALLAGSPAAPEETFFVVRRLLAALAASKPVVLVIDDLQWAEPLLLDLVEHLVQWGSGVPLLVLIGARPELRDVRSSLVTPGGLVADVLTLAGLDAGAAMRLAANVIGATDLPAAVAAKVLATSEGNPLFVGELVRMLVHEGALKKDGERWTAGTALAALEMPPTIHALLAARIERLGAEERSVLERAAVVGRHFSRSAVAELLPREAKDLDARLESLRRSELIERDTGWLLGEPVLRFHHVLIRDAAYRRILKGTRAELHARFAEWVRAKAGDAIEHDETIGWHLEQAHQCLRELGPIDAKGRSLGERASTHLAAAGRRALARDDLPLAASLLGRALERLDAEDPNRADLALDWCEALLASGDVGPAAGAIDELGRFIADSDRLRAWHTCFAGQHLVLTAPSALHATADSVAAAAGELTALDDAAGEAKAHYVHALALSRLGKVGACEAALDRALAAARRAGDRRRANTVLAIAPLAALWGPSPVTRASGRCLDVVRVLRITQGAPAVEAVALSCQGVLEALRGRGDAARRMIASARRMVEELGITQRLLEADVFGGLVELLEGDAAAAERSLRGAYEGLCDLGLGIDAARAAALLARALLAQDRADEAEALSHESEALAGDDLKAAIAWRGVRAEALARRGEHAMAVEFANKAVEIAATTDALLDHADARLALAAALCAAGRGPEADAEERRATELWEAKGATLLAGRAQRVAPVAAPAAEPIAGPLALRRRVRPNAATAMQARFDVALDARDFDAIAASFHENHQEIDHPTGSTYGRDACIASLQRLFRSRDPHYEVEPLATLGELLLLVRRRYRAGGAASARYDVGAYENEALQLFEVDERGLCRRTEVFAADRLGDAVARLYERHSELLPEGAERERVASFARSIAAMASQPDAVRRAAVFAPDVEMVDHRTIGTWSASGVEAAVRHFESIEQVADEPRLRDHDVRAADDDALLVLRTHTGVARQSGGAYERRFLALFAAGADGRLGHIEWFEADREVEALARFDALTAEPAAPRSVQRRVRPKAASAVMARFEAAFAARDVETLEALYASAAIVVDHSNGASYGRAEEVASIRQILRARDPRWRHTPVATLGAALSLHRRSISARGTEGGRFDVADYEVDHIVVIEVDEEGRYGRVEVFAADHLGDAIARLYERHAESLPEGPEHDRATATARSLAALLLAPDVDRIRAAIAPGVETIDHQVLGYPKGRGREVVLRAIQVQLDTADGITAQVEALLSLQPGALLVRRTITGTLRMSGGRYEKQMISLYLCDSDGLVEHWEQFGSDREAEALARFDAVVGREAELPGAPFANVASRSIERETRCFAERDWEGVLAIASPALRFDDRRRMMHFEFGYEDWVAQTRLLFDQPASRWHEPLLATRGERLSLHRVLFEAEVEGGGGPLAIDDHLALIGVDADGRWIAVVLLDLDAEDAAYAELDARFEADADARHAHAVVGWLHAVARRDWDAVAALCSPAFVEHDHRPLAVLGTTRGPEAWARNFGALVELAPDTAPRFEHVKLGERAVLWTLAWRGTREGGDYEIPLCGVLEMDAQGRIARAEIYDPGQLGEARTRFDELESAAPPAGFANAASRVWERMISFLRSRDWPRFTQALPDRFRVADRRRVSQLELDGPSFVAFARSLADMQSFRATSHTIATRGDRLHLAHTRLEFAGGDVGTSELEVLDVLELDERGDPVVLVRFDADCEDAARAELDARFETQQGGPHGNGWRAFRALHGAIERRDWGALRAALNPRFLLDDHRRLSFGTTVDNVELWIRTQRSLAELAPDSRYRVDHIRSSSGAYLAQVAQVGTREGGAFESPLVYVAALDASGRFERNDAYDLEDLDQALARFDELSSAAPPPARFANTATRAWDEVLACFAAHDPERFAELHPPELQYLDRRRTIQLDLDRDQFLEFTRPLREMGTTRSESLLLGTRGDRLALVRYLVAVAEGDVGPRDIVSLLLIATNERGLPVTYVRIDADALDAAYAELDARWDSGEAAAHPHASAWTSAFRRVFASRDWDALAALCSPALVAQDHRLVGWGTLRGPAAWIPALQSLAELAPDAQLRFDHQRMLERGVLFEAAWIGTRDGGAFEIPVIAVVELDARGKQERLDVYDLGQLDQARARFDELTAAAWSPPRFANAATATSDPVIACLVAHDWAGFEALFAESFRCFDRRRMVQLDFDRDAYVAFTREVADGRSARGGSAVLATRGERLALVRSTFVFTDANVGPSEIAFLLVTEVDERGRITAYVRFDVDDLDVAYAELDARWAAGEAATHPLASVWAAAFRRGFAARDWAAMATLTTPDQVAVNHRLLGWGTMSGPGAWVRALEELVGLAADTQLRIDHLRTCERGFLWTSLWHGTRDGGAFETPWILFVELDARGRERRLDVWDIEQLEVAFERFESLRATTPRDPLAALAKPNAATAARERAGAAFAAGAATGDWEPMRALCAQDMRFEDRQRLSRISGDRELYLASVRERVAAGASPTASLIATAGDRVDVSRFLYSGGPPDGRFEIAFLCVFEVDASGVITAIIMFDPDDARVAQREAWARWAAIDPVAAPWVALLSELTDAWNAHDVARVRACFADAVVVEDHRLAGLGRIEGADAYVDSFVALWDLAPDQRVEFHRSCAVDQHGVVFSLRRAGTLESGGAFETEYAWLALATGGRITRLELFEIDALDAALARFEALRPDPQGVRLESRAQHGEPKASEVDALAIPPNAASRAFLIAQEMASGDLAAFRSIVTDDFCFDDRSRRAQLRGGVEEWQRALQFLGTETRARHDVRLVATAGDQLSLHRVVWQEPPGESPFLLEFLRLTEVDAAGKLRAVVLFDAIDRAAASAELFERWVASGADDMPGALIEFTRAANARDLARARSALCDDFVLDDHRRTGMGRVEGADAYIASVVALFELSPDVRVDALYNAALAEHGCVRVMRLSGTNMAGGAFESFYVLLARFRGERVASFEFFEPEQLDVALTRFEALRRATDGA